MALKVVVWGTGNVGRPGSDVMRSPRGVEVAHLLLYRQSETEAFV